MNLTSLASSKRTRFATLAIFLALSSCIALAQTPQVGSAAPGFTLNSQDGKPVSLKNFRGQWVVLYFYPKDFTSGCTIEAHGFQQDQPKYAQRHAVVLGVSVDSEGSHKSFCAKEGLHFKLLADNAHQVTRSYGSLTTYEGQEIANRNTFIINPDGVIAKQFIDVDPNHHSQEVLAALDDLHPPAQALK